MDLDTKQKVLQDFARKEKTNSVFAAAAAIINGTMNHKEDFFDHDATTKNELSSSYQYLTFVCREIFTTSYNLLFHTRRCLSTNKWSAKHR